MKERRRKRKMKVQLWAHWWWEKRRGESR